MALVGSQFVLDWIFLFENFLEERLVLRLWPLYLLGPVGHRIGQLFFIWKRWDPKRIDQNVPHLSRGCPPPPQPLLEKSCARPCHFLKCSILKFSYERKCIYLVYNIFSICFFLSLDGEDVRRYLLMVRGGFCFFPSSS